MKGGQYRFNLKRKGQYARDFLVKLDHLTQILSMGGTGRYCIFSCRSARRKQGENATSVIDVNAEVRTTPDKPDISAGRIYIDWGSNSVTIEESHPKLKCIEGIFEGMYHFILLNEFTPLEKSFAKLEKHAQDYLKIRHQPEKADKDHGVSGDTPELDRGLLLNR